MFSTDEKVAQLEEEFPCSAEYLLQKNSDLYHRLA
jgi:hypothetical protein